MKMTHQHYVITETKNNIKNILFIYYITTMEIIKNQINQLENSKLFKDLEYKCKKSEYNRIYYLKHTERLIKENTEYFKHYEKAQDNTRLYNRVKYYYNNGTFKNVNRNEAIEITKYLINNNLSIKYIPFVKEYLELSKIKII